MTYTTSEIPDHDALPSTRLRKEEPMNTNPHPWNRVAAAAKLLLLVALFVVMSPLIARAQLPPEPAELWETDGSNIYNTNENYVGIGTNTPVYKLDVWGSRTRVARFTNTDGETNVLITAPMGYNANLMLLNGDDFRWLFGNIAGNDRLGIVQATGLEVFSVLQDGKVGIGTTVPDFQLDVVGQLNTSGGLCISGVCKSDWAQTSQWNTLGANIHFTGGNVGIGTTNPGSPLEINSNQNAVVRLMALNNPSNGASAQSALSFFEGATEKAKFGVNSSGAAGYVGGQNAFQIWNLTNAPIVFGTNGAERLRVSAAGSVGIGTTAPGYLLDVQGGQINSSGGICIAGDCKTAWSQVGGQWSASGSNLSYTAGNVGIGTTTPDALLEVNKNQNAGTSVVVDNAYTSATNSAYSGLMLKQSGVNRLLVASVNDNNSTATAGPGAAQVWNFANGPLVFATNNSEKLRLDAAGNLGIGTTTPGDKLVTIGNSLVGNITTHTQLYSTYNTQNNAILEVGYGTATAGDAPLASLVISKNQTGTSNVVGAIQFANRSIADGTEKRLAQIANYTDGATNSGNLLFSTTNAGTPAERMRITASGLIGMGTNAPALPLEIRGNAAVFNSDARAMIGNYDLTAMAQGVGGGIQFGGKADTNGAVAGFASISGIKENATNGDFSSALVFTTRAHPATQSEKLRITSTGRIGIGTNAPTANLEVSSGTAQYAPAVNIMASAHATSERAAISFGVNSAANVGWQLGQDRNGNGTRDMYLYDIANTRDVMYWGSNGNVAIGTTDVTGTNKLKVSGNVSAVDINSTGNISTSGNIDATGNITATGSIGAKYQDVAEWVETSQALRAGTVVVLDQTRSNQVVASSHSYDTSVAGVISAQPGITLGEKSETKVLVATTGRVKVKVDASAGPIRIGDLLVTSDVAGVAKKSEPLNLGGVQIHRPGTLIGKALEPLASGTGEILVLLSLQ